MLISCGLKVCRERPLAFAWRYASRGCSVEHHTSPAHCEVCGACGYIRASKKLVATKLVMRACAHFAFSSINTKMPPGKHVFFIHGDINAGKHSGQKAHFMRYLMRPLWPAWPESLAEMQPEHCGCGPLGTLHSPFGPRDFWFESISWWLGSMLTRSAANESAHIERWASSADCDHGSSTCSRSGMGAYPLHGGALSSPRGFMFAIDRAAAIGRRSKRFLAAQYRLCRYGLRVLPRGLHEAPPNHTKLRPPAFSFPPLTWGHANERLPFFLFGAEFRERHVPECVFEGDYLSMNCTVPLAIAQPQPVPRHSQIAIYNRTMDATNSNATTGTTVVPPLVSCRVGPTPVPCCLPFDQHCGMAG